MHAISDILEDLRAGRMIVLVDDENRENEGDIVLPAQFVTPEAITFMLREACGMMCVALSGGICQGLDLQPQAAVNTTQRGTAYTVTVDAHERFGITTGVSASDRAITIRRLADPVATAGDFARPGHVQPLRARDGGCLVRAGQTEGSVDLCRLAGLTPAAVIIEIMKEDGTMARRDDLESFCEKHGLKMCSVAEVIQYRLGREKLVERVAEAPIDTVEGPFTLIAYRSVVDALPHVALVCGDVGKVDEQGATIEIDEPVLVRMHSQNLLGDVFGDVGQPSGQTLHRAMKLIRERGRGAVVYLRHESMGTGLLRQLHTANRGADEQRSAEFAANHETPGVAPPRDKGAYGIGSQILRDLGIRQLQLVTDHPFHPTALEGFGLSIESFVSVPK